MANVKFEDNSIKIEEAIKQACVAWLHEAAGEIQAQTKRGCDKYVDTGKTKNSWQYKVNESEGEAIIGSDYENALWEEFGTGIYASKGNGRKNVPWHYKDAEGKWHATKGKKARHTLQQAFDGNENKLKKSLEQKLKELK